MNVETLTPPTARAAGTAPEAVLEQHKLLAPPFIDPAAWKTFQTPTPKHFWSAVVLVPLTGHLVLQLGAEPEVDDPPPIGGFLSGGFRRTLSLTGGFYRWSLVFDMGPRTVIPPADWIHMVAYLTLTGNGFRDTDSLVLPAVSEMEPPDVPLTVGGMLPGGDYTLEVGVAILVNYHGSQRPYCEVVAKTIRGLHQFKYSQALEDDKERTRSFLKELRKHEKDLRFEEIRHPKAEMLARLRDAKLEG